MSRNVSTFLKESLAPSQLELIQCVAEQATALGSPLYIVGGFVRDLLLGRPNFDLDLVVEGDAPSLARILEEKYGGKVTVHSRFSTAKWFLHGSKIATLKTFGKVEPQGPALDFLDLASSRSEIYKHPASLPTVKVGSIEDDIKRRDFTINTLAIRVDGPLFGELRDDFGGAADAKKGIVRVLHERSFLDDPTRMFRAARYEQRLGFKIDAGTIALIPEARSLIDELSAQRIRHELDLILEEPKAAAILGRLAELDLLTPIHAALPWDEFINQRIQASELAEIPNRSRSDVEVGQNDNRLMGWLLWLLGLNEKQIQSLNIRLHFTSHYLKAFLAASKLMVNLGKLIEWKPSKCVEYLDEMPYAAIQAVYLATPDGDFRLLLEKYIKEWRNIQPRTTGSDLKKLGLQSGPDYQTILRELRNAWLDREIIDELGEKRRLEETLLRLRNLQG